MVVFYIGVWEREYYSLFQDGLQALEDLWTAGVMVSVGTLGIFRGKQPTSSSIFASAMSCSLPLPLAIFCASEICAFTASALKSSSG